MLRKTDCSNILFPYTTFSCTLACAVWQLVRLPWKLGFSSPPAAYRVWFLIIYKFLSLKWEYCKDCPILHSFSPSSHLVASHLSRVRNKYVHVWGEVSEDFSLEENQRKTSGDFLNDQVVAVVLLTTSESASGQPSASVVQSRQSPKCLLTAMKAFISRIWELTAHTQSLA